MHYDPEEKVTGHLGIRFVKKSLADGTEIVKKVRYNKASGNAGRLSHLHDVEFSSLYHPYIFDLIVYYIVYRIVLSYIVVLARYIHNLYCIQCAL